MRAVQRWSGGLVNPPIPAPPPPQRVGEPAPRAAGRSGTADARAPVHPARVGRRNRRRLGEVSESARFPSQRGFQVGADGPPSARNHPRRTGRAGGTGSGAPPVGGGGGGGWLVESNEFQFIHQFVHPPVPPGGEWPEWLPTQVMDPAPARGQAGSARTAKGSSGGRHPAQRRRRLMAGTGSSGAGGPGAGGPGCREGAELPAMPHSRSPRGAGGAAPPPHTSAPLPSLAAAETQPMPSTMPPSRRRRRRRP